jgi:phosphoglycerate dehydrogenase-like enzyme
MKRVLVTAPFPSQLVEKIKAASSELNVTHLPLTDGQWPAERTTDAEIIYAVNTLPPLEQAPNLRWVQMHWAGVDRWVDTAVWRSDVLITNASGIHAPNMAQYALTQILAWAQRVPAWFRQQQKGQWPRERWNTFLPDELRERTLGIVGYGSIGRELARLVKPFGAAILATKNNARRIADSGYCLPGAGDPEGTLPDRIYPGEALRSMAAECDYVVLCLPLTPKSHHVYDESVLREMKPTSYLVNIGRGELIPEKDLVKALKKGWIAGAGLDVFETEPLPEKSPLWDMDNVILTPHVSGFTAHYEERAVDLFTENLLRYLAGEPLLNLVDREEGY